MPKINQKNKQRIFKILIIFSLAIIISKVIVLSISILNPKIIGAPSFNQLLCIDSFVTSDYLSNIKTSFFYLFLLFAITATIFRFLKKQHYLIFLFLALLMAIYSATPPNSFSFDFKVPVLISLLSIIFLSIISCFLYKTIKQENILSNKDNDDLTLKNFNLKKIISLNIFLLILSIWNSLALQESDNLSVFTIYYIALAFVFGLIFIIYKKRSNTILILGIIISLFNLFYTFHTQIVAEISAQFTVFLALGVFLFFEIIHSSKNKLLNIKSKKIIRYLLASMGVGILLFIFNFLEGGREFSILITGFFVGHLFIKERKIINYITMSIIVSLTYVIISSSSIFLLMLAGGELFNKDSCALNVLLDISSLSYLILGMTIGFIPKSINSQNETNQKQTQQNSI